MIKVPYVASYQKIGNKRPKPIMKKYKDKKFHISRLTNYDICKLGLIR